MATPRIQILLSHPNYSNSRANRALVEMASRLDGVEVTHLEDLYPDGGIDCDAEVARLVLADLLVLQFPMQWYSTPPALKAWQDRVLTRMFYINPDTEGAKLAGRPLMVAATLGNRSSAYTAEGVNLFSAADLLKPLQSTANRCGLSWQEPFLVYEARHATDEALASAARSYLDRLISTSLSSAIPA
ncbi:NAD(P)H-dependent oxidoreductase [Luteolibacter sp. GHJ8]|uniref:NAD(P)H-dependent oxidoreductase n=1 Tax=Luteolibacter rhizosphaerae TaxID=2989719 RepID=A0ABT3G9G9_9BACT|nr:NAD(P)H-dependent oxidoreductase [Luteolibacter rhizosphaerae]MCW1916254.1 NAD(P)H-dependent oxidoreductase [Luteolibacter rhizosphaerae]